ncbi:hypothetical protein AB0K05_12115 [Nonomuraea sp. NPDC049486]|uniref:hypothetical protein n=1 Tax=Nonomuraea sp. NPDC049486 TaxID=3155773 RepID=UPI003417B680
MTTEPETAGNQPSKRRFPRTLLLAATAALVVATGAGVATAAATPPSGTPAPAPTATESPSTGPSDKPSKKEDRRHWDGPKINLHGEFVVREGEGEYVTVATQRGEVTAVDQDSLTVKSEDGYSREYAVGADTRINRDATIDTVKTGQKVSVLAKVDGETATAVAIRAKSEGEGKGKDRRHMDGPHEHRHGKPESS